MPKYQCPECEAVLRRAEAIAPGKKIRCPKCEAVFPAKAMPDDEPEPAPEGYALAGQPKAAPKSAAVDDEEDSNPYSVIKESEDEVKPEIHLGSLRDKFAKSKIGPAMFKTVVPSNWLLRCGLITGVVAVFFFIFGIWPVIFCEANPSRPFIRPRVDIMIRAVILFVFAAITCLGAAKLHDLTSFAWAIVGAVMAVPAGIVTGALIARLVGNLILEYVPIVFGIIVVGYSAMGLWCMITALTGEVRAGFKERVEELEY
jgi:hypothetical protein